ncbi:MAG: zinc ribbon domain-containing protein [Thiohalocapsa sp.]|uniref:FmdB family zinc ribbon protein n=1 Tax=Thiohalocapsa sp. TaxID=2497641 RepID=UPI0025FEEA8F|nr:zinc ribbon domain-containing protein [Thiohalocapsa sp.]MCG6941465.1 zinc ribbon domain-containing protein [Thiohalocapsa sp.]
MPVYEFYCPDCHAIYNFFSRRPDTETRPGCPSCGRPDLERQVSMFAISRGRGEREDDADAALPEGVDEAAMMKAMAAMADELEHVDDDDPKQAARVMRRLFDSAGLKLGDAMADMMARMEAGEDPDQLEAEYADVLDAEDPLAGLGGGGGGGLRGLRRKLLPPRRDDKWYPLT